MNACMLASESRIYEMKRILGVEWNKTAQRSRHGAEEFVKWIEQIHGAGRKRNLNLNFNYCCACLPAAIHFKFINLKFMAAGCAPLSLFICCSHAAIISSLHSGMHFLVSFRN